MSNNIIEQLKSFVELQSSAAPGPWRVVDYCSEFWAEFTDENGAECLAAKFFDLDDAVLFAAARTFPAAEILEQLEELEKENVQLTAMLQESVAERERYRKLASELAAGFHL